MSYFKLDMDKFYNELSEYQKIKKIYSEDLNSFYRILNDVDSVWNSLNVAVFKSNIENDKIKVFDYLLSLDSLCNNLKNFYDELSKILYSYTSIKSAVVRFDDSQFINCLRYLSNTIYYLNHANYIINDKLLSSNIYYYNKLKSKIDEAIYLVKEIKSNFEDYMVAFPNLIQKYKDHLACINALDLNLKKFNFNSKLMDI